ncbi:hypothetical protein B566_EDAN018120 [Ephemera danica]|nr:hypothetical protein B566_EDAN018120 [Ephemera danica]
MALVSPLVLVFAFCCGALLQHTTQARQVQVPTWFLLRHNVSEAELLHAPIGPERTWGTIGSTIWNWITGGGSSGSGGGGGGSGGGGGGGILGGIVNPPNVVGATSGTGGSESGEVPSEGCGKSKSQLKIVGGHATKVNQYPWMAMLSYDNRFYCGGTLINTRFVLTAAHCVDGFTARRIQIRLLEHDRNSASETRVITRGVRTATVHPRYNQNTFNNDIALLRLDQDVPFNGDIQPACLPEKGKRYTGEEGIVTGWGKVGESKPVSPVLQEVTVPILSNTKCSSFYGTSQITDNMLCAGFKEGGRDSCQGDSGGPLHVRNGSIHHIAGVVSWGEGCARPNNPGVYARVNRYLSWITANTEGTCFCTPS